MEDLLKGFPVAVEQALSWGDMDMHGHINNIWFFRYIENARIAYYEAIGKYEHEKETGAGLVLASTSCKFKSPLAYPDTVATGARIEEILEDRAIMSYRVISFPEVLTQRISEVERKSL